MYFLQNEFCVSEMSTTLSIKATSSGLTAGYALMSSATWYAGGADGAGAGGADGAIDVGTDGVTRVPAGVIS